MKVLIVGFGSIGRQHYQSVLRVFGEQPVQVALLRRRCDDQLDILQFDSVSAAQQWQPNLVIIASPATTHLDFYNQFIGVDSVQAVLLEKPLCADVAEIAHFSLPTKPVALGFDLRQYPLLHALKQQIVQASFGRVLAVHARVGQALPTWRQSEDFRLDVSAQKTLGGGVIRELCHELDYLLFLGFTPTSTFATTGKSRWLDLDVEDSAYIQADVQNVSLSHGVVPASISLDMVSSEPFRRVQIDCENGRFTLDFIENTLTIDQFGIGIEKTNGQSEVSALAQQLRSLIESIGTGALHPDLCSLSGGVKVMKWIETIEKSAESGQRCEVAYA